MAIHRIRVLALVLAATLVLPAVTQAAPFTHLIAYGDSLSDNGNVFAASGGTFPPAPYDRRMSNGPVAVEYMAAALGLPLIDVAFAGATTGTTNVLGAGLPGMLLEFAGGPPVDPSALYLVWGGPNDFLSGVSDPGAAIAGAVTNLMSIVDGLSAGGVQEILVPGMPDLSLTPRARALGPIAQAQLHALSMGFNNVLLSELLLRPNTTFFDTAMWLNAVVANPAAFGFTNETDACKSPAVAGFPGTVCADPDGYLFFDDVHPTTAVHERLGRQFATAVPEPSVFLLVAAGLACAARWRTVRSRR